MYKGKYTGKKLEEILDSASKYALFDDMWEALDGTIVDKEKHIYGLNGLNDITYQQAVAILERANFTNQSLNILANTVIRGVRTNFAPTNPGGSVGLTNFRIDENIEVIALCLPTQSALISDNTGSYWSSATKLRKVIGRMNISGKTSGTFSLLAPNLEEVEILNAKCAINISGSPVISLESFQFLVANAANTADITVTVHPDVYAKMTDEGNAEWNKVFTDAVAKKIAFATV